MTSGDAAKNFVKPSLHLCGAPESVPATSTAVRKAVRDFDGCVRDAAALGAHKRYELPNRGAKAGVTTVDVTMSEAQVALFFPDQKHRLLKRGSALVCEFMRYFLVMMFAFTCAWLYYSYNFVRVLYWSDVLYEIMSLAFAYMNVAYYLAIMCLWLSVWYVVTVGLSAFAAFAPIVTFLTHCRWLSMLIMFVDDSVACQVMVALCFGLLIAFVAHWIRNKLCRQRVPVVHPVLPQGGAPRGRFANVAQRVLMLMAPYLMFVGMLLVFYREFLHSIISEWFWVARNTACDRLQMIDYSLWFCPRAEPTRLERFQALLLQALLQVYQLAGQPLFWQSVCVFFIVGYLVNWATYRRTAWCVRLKIESQAFSIASTQKIRAQQETTSEKVAACPIITHVCNHVMVTHAKMPVTARDKYIAICVIITSGWANNRVRVVDETAAEPDSTTPEDNPRESLGDVGNAKRLLLTRNNTAPPNVWRRSVRVLIKPWTRLFDDRQRGQDRTLPGDDGIKEYYCGLVTGPELIDITPGFCGDQTDEIAGVSRHLRELKSTVTGEGLDREISPEAEARLNMATDIICSIVKVAAKAHFLALATWQLPKKWGNACATYYQRVVECASTIISPVLSGFVKVGELALPLNKLPRLVGSMGMLACAKDAASLCCVESLFKKFFPHLVLKGMTNDGLCARFAEFAGRASRLNLQILSIDMSAMDSSWTPNDRKRVRRVLETIVDALRELLDAEYQKGYVEQCASKKCALRWMLKYITVQLEADDSVLFSGERGTSIGNRILMLIVWSAELLRVYSDGEKRIRLMFHCPPEAFHDCIDERQEGPVEQNPTPLTAENSTPTLERPFADDERNDNNTGDGDDCTLAIPKDMYECAQDFILAYEKYYKLVEPCSAWDESSDLECLSTMCIRVEDKYLFVPKVKRNAQRLIAHKIRVPPGSHYAEGTQTYVPTVKDYAEIATDLWQRSFSLKHSMVVRHLCRAMFEYCYAKCGNIGTVYDQDLHRLGKVDGDVRLSVCLEEVRQNAACHTSAWAMIKATHFSTMASLTVAEIRALKQEWFDADASWSTLDLTDDLCASSDVLLTTFPIGPNIAQALGFKQELIELLKRQLVKEEGALPEMRDGTRPGSSEDSTRDGAEPTILRAASVVVYRGDKVLCGYEPRDKLREGMLSLPGGKLEKDETFEQAAARELSEEGGITVSQHDLRFVHEHKYGNFQCRLFSVHYDKTTPSTVLSADRLVKPEFRTVAEIVSDHAPRDIAQSIKEVIRNGAFLPAAIGGKSKPTAASPPARNVAAPGSSALQQQQHPSCEVKAAVAETDATGPSPVDKFAHSHDCPVCWKRYTHSHPHAIGFVHKQWRGACPDPACSFHMSSRLQPADAITSRNQRQVRQASGSSPVNGSGTSRPSKSAGKGTAGKTSSTGFLSPSAAVSQNADKSHAPSAESKGPARSPSEGNPRKWHRVEAQTAGGAMTSAPKSDTSGPPISDGKACGSKDDLHVVGPSRVSADDAAIARAVGGVLNVERAGISGQSDAKAGDPPTPPDYPGRALG